MYDLLSYYNMVYVVVTYVNLKAGSILLDDSVMHVDYNRVQKCFEKHFPSNFPVLFPLRPLAMLIILMAPPRATQK